MGNRVRNPPLMVPNAVPGMEELFPEAIDALLAEAEQMLTASKVRQNTFDVEACLLYQNQIHKRLMYLAEKADSYTERYGLPDGVLDTGYSLNVPAPNRTMEPQPAMEPSNTTQESHSTEVQQPSRARWTAAEHALLEQGITKYGLRADHETVRRITEIVPTRDLLQVRDKIQFLLKRNKNSTNDSVASSKHAQPNDTETTGNCTRSGTNNGAVGSSSEAHSDDKTTPSNHAATGSAAKSQEATPTIIMSQEL